MSFTFLKAKPPQRLLVEDIMGHVGYELTEPRQNWLANKLTRNEANIIVRSFLDGHWDNTISHFKGINNQLF